MKSSIVFLLVSLSVFSCREDERNGQSRGGKDDHEKNLEDDRLSCSSVKRFKKSRDCSLLIPVITTVPFFP